MNILKESGIVLRDFDKEYRPFGAARYRIVDDSVILICGLVKHNRFFFDVIYSCIPVFSFFDTNPLFLNNASGFVVCRETTIGKGISLPIKPTHDEETATLELACKQAEYAYDVLGTVGNLDECLAMFASQRVAKADCNYIPLPKYQHIDILIYLEKYEECLSMLNDCMNAMAKNAFDRFEVSFPDDGCWKEMVPPRFEDCRKGLESELFAINDSCWKRYRLPLERGEYSELRNKQLADYLKNKKKLNAIGLDLGNKSCFPDIEL